jgi:hypothetical protein
MGETLSEWLIKHGWKQLEGSTLYSGEGEKFRKPKGYDAHGEIWIAPMSFGLLSIAPYIAGYFVDEENASHEYVFGPAAEQLAKAIAARDKECQG